MARKKLTIAQRKTKNEVERIRRMLEKNIAQAKKNGWALKQGMWFGDNSACLFGVVMANKAGVSNPIDAMCEKSYEFGEEEYSAAVATGLSTVIVSDIIQGWDEQETFSSCEWSESPYYRLGFRLAKKHLGRKEY